MAAQTDNPRGFWVSRVLYGGVVPVWHGKLKSNAKVASGDVLFATAGYLTPTETTDKAPVGIAITQQLTSITTTNPDFLFYPNMQGVIFAAQEDGTPTQADIWTKDDFLGTAGNSTGISSMEIDTDGGDNTLLRVAFSGITSIGANPETEVVFLKSKFTGQTSSTFVGN